MARIAQIIPYFGKWPEWFELYLYSCSKNPMVDFIFYTDCPIPTRVYANTKFIAMSTNEYYTFVGNRLGIDYSIDTAYKLTDLKPFLGAVHELELRGYEFWSFGDIDLVYGDLSMLLNNHNLDKYDLITTHNYHIAGHFTVLKNNDYYRNVCFRIPNWQSRLCGDTHYGFDEGEWSALVFPGLFYNRIIWKYLVRRLGITNFFRFMDFANSLTGGRRHFKEYFTSPAPKIGEVWNYHASNGKVMNGQGKELPYIHFLFFKKTPWFDTELYWRQGYYKLSTTDFASMKSINISLDGIE